MRLPDDDELYEVDQTYLGPPRRYIAPMRHKVIFIWLALGPATFVLAHRLGLPLNVLSVGLLLLGTIYAAQVLGDKATPEKPIASLFASFWHDLAAPRGKRTGHRAHGTLDATRPGGPLGRHLNRREVTHMATTCCSCGAKVENGTCTNRKCGLSKKTVWPDPKKR